MIKMHTVIALLLTTAIASSQVPTIIGTTTFDFQSNWGSKDRLQVYTGGDVSAAWVGSDATGAAFNDRGTYFNSYDGSWGPFPTERFEGTKTGYCELLRVLDHEVVVSQSTTPKLQLYKNSAAGANDWTETTGSNTLSGWYPMAYCPSGTNDIYVVYTKSSQETLYFSRSDDGGETWAVSEYAIPYCEEAYGFDHVFGDTYQIAVHGTDVYVLFGSLGTDLILLHSASNGAAGTWSIMNTILDFPIDNYDAAAGEDTDWDGDGDFDWLDTNDGMHEMIITNDGTVHVFTGRMQIRDLAAVTGFYYDYTKAGIYHWKTGDASATLYEGMMIDWDNTDGAGDPFAGIGANLDSYFYESATTMPTASWDATTGRIYLVYMMPVEYTDDYDNPDNSNAQSRYDLFGCYSDNDGVTWTPPINLTYTAFLDHENAFPSAYDFVKDDKVHVLWQQDLNPGCSVDGSDDIHTNNMLYVAWDSTRFQPYDPTVAFTYVATPFGPDYSVAFTNLSVDAEDYSWNFGDGAPLSTLVNPTHVYSSGIYTVCLTGYNHYGDATSCQSLILLNEPVADFSYTGDPTVNFYDESTGGIPDTWYWTFGDGFTSTLENPVHTYAANGTYNVCLTASNDMGESTFCQNVYIDAYPVANFTFTDADPLFSFFDASTGDPTGFGWDWDFGDGGASTFENPTHTYLENGTYTVCLTASNIYGSNTACDEVVVNSYTAPIVDFDYSGGPTVDFIDMSTGAPYLWDWDFGDGYGSSDENPTHTFAANGTYVVCLIATNDLGSGSACKNVIIDDYAAPEALFTYDSGDPIVTFTDLSTGSPFAWVWDFGDGGFSSIEHPTHTYDENGIYLVCLTVTGPGGSDSYCDNVEIDLAQLAPVADFTWSSTGVLTLSFTDLSANDPASWSWDFGDGAISTFQNPVHTYATAGEYEVCLTATNDIGSNTSCQGVAVTSIENTTLSFVNIFPNPAGQIITVDAGEPLNEFTLSVKDELGQNISLETIEITGSLITFDINDLASGTYFISIVTDAKIYAGSFIRN